MAEPLAIIATPNLEVVYPKWAVMKSLFSKLIGSKFRLFARLI
jgi:hypothetical protein